MDGFGRRTTEDGGQKTSYRLSSVLRRLSSELAPVAGIEPAYSPLNRRRRAPCSALTGMVENRGNAPRMACLQGEPEPLLVPHPASRCALRRICIRAIEGWYQRMESNHRRLRLQRSALPLSYFGIDRS